MGHWGKARWLADPPVYRVGRAGREKKFEATACWKES